MGIGNFLIEGVSGTGKTSVCAELRRRGYHAVQGDRELAHQGGPTAGEPVACSAHENHLWQVDKVEALVADQSEAMTFFCGGSRNFHAFVHLFDGVFVLDVDPDTLRRRLESRPEDEWGGRAEQREFIMSLHQTKEDVPHDGVIIDATAPVSRVVDEILRQCSVDGSR